MLNNGNFVVAWASYGQDGSDYGTYAQIFDANANKVGSEFRINTRVTHVQDPPSVATLSNGKFVATWHSYIQDGSHFGIYAQIFDEIGTKVDGEFRVNTYTNNSQTYPYIATFTNGNFVIMWRSEFQDGSGYGVYAQIFDETGSKIEGEFQVNTYVASNQLGNSVATFSDGNFGVVWQSNGQDGSSYGIYAQLFNSNGAKMGDEFRVNSYTVDDQTRARIVALKDGNFIIAWDSNLQDGSGKGIYAQIFNGSGEKVGDEFQINTYTTNDQCCPAVAAFENGDFVVVWQSNNQDGSGDGIFGKIFKFNIPPVVNKVIKTGTKNTALTFSKDDFVNVFTDADGHSMTKIRITSLPGGGSLKLLSSGAVIEGQEIDVDDIEYLVFDPNEGWPRTTSFGWQAFDGFDYSDVKAVNINIENRANGLAIEATSKKSVCGCDCDIPTPIDDTLSIIDTNDVSLRGAKVTMSRDVDLAFDSLEFDDQNGITGSYDPSKGILLLDGKSSVDNYQEALRSVKYKHRGAFLPSKAIAMSLAVNDGFSDSDPVIVNINGEDCSVGDPPIIGDVYKEGIEDDVVSFTKDDFADKFRDENADNELVQIEIVSLPEYGILKSSRFGNIVAGQKILAENLDDLRFVPDKDWVGDPSFKWKGYNCQSSSDEANVDIKISNDLSAEVWSNVWWPTITATITTVLIGVPFAIVTWYLTKKAKVCCFKERERNIELNAKGYLVAKEEV